MLNLKFINFKIIILIIFINKIYSEIIPIHIGSPNHRNFQRTPTKNENNLRASGLIPVGKNQINTLIQPNIQNDKNQNFEYSKRIGLGKRSTYTLQNTRNQIDHSNYDRNNYLQSYTPLSNNNYYQNEKQRIFNINEMNHYSPNNYHPNTYQSNNYQPNIHQTNTYQPNNYQPNIHQPKQYGYIFNGNTNHRDLPQYNSQYGNQQQFFNQQPMEQHYNQQRDNPDQQNSDLELNDIGLDSYDMPFGDQQFDNNNHLYNDVMNFDMPNLY